MNELLAVVLVCMTSVPQATCLRDTAVDVMVTPASTPYDCARRGQVLVASGVAGSLGQDTYLKIMCERRKPRATAQAPDSAPQAALSDEDASGR